MTLHPQTIGPVPDDTARVIGAAFPRAATYMAPRDDLGLIFRDADFAALFSARGWPAEAPWRLALADYSPVDALYGCDAVPFPRVRRGPCREST